jgi:hypothetical protein
VHGGGIKAVTIATQVDLSFQPVILIGKQVAEKKLLKYHKYWVLFTENSQYFLKGTNKVDSETINPTA